MNVLRQLIECANDVSCRAHSQGAFNRGNGKHKAKPTAIPAHTFHTLSLGIQALHAGNRTAAKETHRSYPRPYTGSIVHMCIGTYPNRKARRVDGGPRS